MFLDYVQKLFVVRIYSLKYKVWKRTLKSITKDRSCVLLIICQEVVLLSMWRPASVGVTLDGELAWVLCLSQQYILFQINKSHKFTNLYEINTQILKFISCHFFFTCCLTFWSLKTNVVLLILNVILNIVH